MINKIQTALVKALAHLGVEIEPETINVEKSKRIALGDFSTNVAMLMAPKLGESAMTMAKKICQQLESDWFEDVNVSNPGFINFRLKNVAYDTFFGELSPEYPVFPKTHKMYNLEYVSANPTGLLHIGHARNAVIGSVLATLIHKTGNDIATEYYINDAGSQMDKLGSSVFVRYKQRYQWPVMELPEDAYHGDEINDVVDFVIHDFGERFLEYDIGEDFIIANPNTRNFFRCIPGQFFLERIRKDLKSLGVNIYHYYSEAELRRQEWINVVLRLLKPYTYEQDGALWLKTTLGGDDKDRVLIKSDGSFTYFLPDIAYHYLKMTRDEKKYEPVKLIDLWGADHYGYFKRLDFALSCLGFPNRLEAVFIQMVRLMKDGAEFKMSKRTGNALTLTDLVNTLGKDAARWFLLSSSPDKHLDIDVDLAQSQTSDNPMYYVQYALVRAKSLLRKVPEINLEQAKFALDGDSDARELLNQLMLFRETIVRAMESREPNKLITYLTTLAKLFHHYYETKKILDEADPSGTASRMKSVQATAQIITNALKLLGIDPLEAM